MSLVAVNEYMEVSRTYQVTGCGNCPYRIEISQVYHSRVIPLGDPLPERGSYIQRKDYFCDHPEFLKVGKFIVPNSLTKVIPECPYLLARREPQPTRRVNKRE